MEGMPRMIGETYEVSLLGRRGHLVGGFRMEEEEVDRGDLSGVSDLLALCGLGELVVPGKPNGGGKAPGGTIAGFGTG